MMLYVFDLMNILGLATIYIYISTYAFLVFTNDDKAIDWSESASDEPNSIKQMSVLLKMHR